MVARITVPLSVSRALNYNEQKTEKGQAECIYAHNFLKEHNKLSFHDKLRHFEYINALNKRATTNTLHVSLNFDPSEKIGTETLSEIASFYMQKIGFGDQPYLVYRHNDAGHPHIHIVATAIKMDGTRISMHNLGRNESTKARKEIEERYQLVKAEKQEGLKNDLVKPVDVQKITYGKSITKRSITNVLDAVIPHYKYASLPELNAILKLYNVVADRGAEGGLIHKTGGLVFRVLDKEGNKIGVPIKASSIYSKPTLKNLQQKFEQNVIDKEQHKKFLKTSIDWIMLKSPRTLDDFYNALRKEKISLVVRQNEDGIVYGLTYVDHKTKCVFNGSEIGKDYSAKAILEKIGHSSKEQIKNLSVPEQNIIKSKKQRATLKEDHREVQKVGGNLIDELMRANADPNYIPREFKKKKRKKRKPNT
ncbi:MAG: relaxase/mobilization nuclease domain-containing protein [Bacteroidota bacterium]